MKTAKKITVEQGMYITGILAFIIGIPLMILYISKLDQRIYPPCVLYNFLGVYCPGCGGSRALKALFSGHFLTSVYYHPLVLYTAVIYLVFMTSQTIALLSRGRIRGIRFHYWFLYGALFVIVINCVLKNVLKFVFGIILF